jgi:hypothetical protein
MGRAPQRCLAAVVGRVSPLWNGALLASCGSFGVNTIGEPDEGEPHVRFDEGEQGRPSGSLWRGGLRPLPERVRQGSSMPVVAGRQPNLFPTLLRKFRFIQTTFQVPDERSIQTSFGCLQGKTETVDKGWTRCKGK